MKILILFICLFYFSSKAGIIIPDVAWKKSNISVCWWNGSKLPLGLVDVDKPLFKILQSQYFKPRFFKKREKSRLEKLINKNFTQEITGIYFTGWQSCKNDVKADVVLLGISDFDVKEDIDSQINEALFIKEFNDIDSFLSSTAGKANIAQMDIRIYNKDKIFVRETRKVSSFAIFPFEKGINFKEKMTFIHEFTHIAGLMHEHYQAEAANDPLCRVNEIISRYITKVTADPPKAFFNVEFTSSYDSFSITNYCFENVLGLMYEAYIQNSAKLQPHPAFEKYITLSELKNLSGLESHKAILSKGDIHAMRCLYKYPDRTQDMNCHQDFNLDDTDLNIVYKKYLKSVL